MLIVRNVKLNTDTLAPARPTGLAATPSSSSIALKWSSNTESNLAGFLVYRSTSSTGTFTRLTSNFAEHRRLQRHHRPGRHYYRVSALDRCGNESRYASITTART
jgi:hypothetical protein